MCTLKKEEITSTCINSFNKKYIINKNYNNNNIINSCNNSSSKENFNSKTDNYKITLKKKSSLSLTTTTTTAKTPSRRRKIINNNTLKNLNCFNYSCNIFRSFFMCTTEKSPSKMANTITNVIRNVVSKQRKRYVANGYDLDLSYICDNIIAMGYPAANIEKWYRNHIDDVVKFLEENHKDHYRIYNLCSERNYDISTFHGRVAVFPFADHNPPTIELMQKFCDDMNSWLKADERNVAAVHCKAGKGRTGTMICCYLLQCGFARTADEALSYYDEKRTKDKKGVTIPSQRRYVEYYAKLITSGKTYERRTLQICEIRFSSPPLSSSQGTVLSLSTLDDPSCPDKVKTLQNFAIDFRKASNVEITDRCIPVTGDVRIELYHKVTKKTLLHLWFNVYFIEEEGERHVNGDDMKIIYEFKKTEIDDAHKDKENKLFTEDFSVQLVFQTIPSRNSYVSVCDDKTDNIDMNASVHSNYHRGRIYSNSANNYIVDNVGSSQNQQMDIQPVIEPLKQQNHNNSNNSSLLNNSNLTIRHQQHQQTQQQQQQRQQQEQYAFPTNQNQYKQQQNRNINAIGPMNLNSTTNSPTASATHNSNNSSTISVKNKNLSLDLSSSLVISPQKQQQQYQQQEQQSQLHQNLHEKQILQQQLHNSKNNIKNPGKISSKHHLQQQPLEQPSSNKTVVISSNQHFQQQQQNQPHESRTNSTSSNTSKSSSNSSSSISISSAASSSACIGEDWESEIQQNILPIEGKVINNNKILNKNKSIINSSSSYYSSSSNKSSLDNNNYYDISSNLTITSTITNNIEQSSIDLVRDLKHHNININSSNINNNNNNAFVVIDDSDNDEVFIRSSSMVMTPKNKSTISKINTKKMPIIKTDLVEYYKKSDKIQEQKPKLHRHQSEDDKIKYDHIINDCFVIDHIKHDDDDDDDDKQQEQQKQQNEKELQSDLNSEKEIVNVIDRKNHEKSQTSTSNLLQRRFSRNFPSVTNTSLGMKAILLKNLKLNYRRGST